MFLEWQPRESGGGLVKQHTDAKLFSVKLRKMKKEQIY
jgi:hypothetical protein